jgi:hypothetical protein
MIHKLTLPFRLAWMPVAWFLRLLGFGAGVKRHCWKPPVDDPGHHLWQVVQDRRVAPEPRPRHVLLRVSPSEAALAPRFAPGVLPLVRPRAGGRRLSRRGRRGILLIPVIVVLAAAAASFAYLTASGSGFGAADAGTSQAVTISPGTVAPGAALYPAGSADVTARISNPNSFSAHLPSLVLDASQGQDGFSVDAGHSGCEVSVLHFAAQTNGGTGFLVPAKTGSTDGTLDVDLTGAISMDATAANACQGATFTVYVEVGP